ncbi:DNA polymerase [Pseudomonas phage WP1]
MIHLDGDIVALAREGQAYRLSRGHIKEWTQVYEDRFQEEIKQIQLKDFDSYFLVVADLVAFAKKHMLVGPARGSSAGSLACYLLGITEADPLPHRLLFQRFIDISRSDLPDIDIDFADTHRYLVFEYLQQKYGTWNVVKLGNINALKAASVIAHVGKRFGIPFHDTDNIKNSITEYTSADERHGKGLEDTFEKTQPGRDFREKYEIASACMGDLEIHPSHSGVHAAGILACNDEVTDFCTVTPEGIAQLDSLIRNI